MKKLPSLWFKPKSKSNEISIPSFKFLVNKTFFLMVAKDLTALSHILLEIGI